MPESSESQSLYIYRAVEFPDKWEKYKILRENIRCVDTIPVIKYQKLLSYKIMGQNRYALAYIDIHESENDIVLQFPSIEKRRPAGNIFLYDKKMIRPAQDCTNDYGKGIIFYNCTISKQNEYDENEIEVMYPEQLKFTKRILLDGMHTYNCSKQYEVIDIKTRRFNILNLLFRVIGKIKKFFCDIL